MKEEQMFIDINVKNSQILQLHTIQQYKAFVQQVELIMVKILAVIVKIQLTQ